MNMGSQPPPKPPATKYLVALFITVAASFVFTLVQQLTDFTANSSTAMILFAIALMMMLLTGFLLILLYVFAKRDSQPQFSNRTILLSGIGFICLVLGIRFEIFMKLLTLLVKLF